MFSVKIENGVQMPTHKGRAAKLPWAQMQIGDSFFVPNVARFNVAHAQVRHGMKFNTKKMTEGGVNGVRVWRVA